MYTSKLVYGSQVLTILFLSIIIQHGVSNLLAIQSCRVYTLRRWEVTLSTGLAELEMARKKAEKPEHGMAKLASDVLRDARIVVAITEEGLSEYLSRLLRPLVAKDKAALLERERGEKPKR